MSKRPFGVAAATAAIAIGVLAPAALAAVSHPKAGSYVQASGNRELMYFQYANGKVTQAHRYDKCITVPLQKVPAMKVSNGHFSYTGNSADYTNRQFQFHVDGTFVTTTKAVGTWSDKQLSGGTCSSSFKYTVTLHH